MSTQSLEDIIIMTCSALPTVGAGRRKSFIGYSDFFTSTPVLGENVRDRREIRKNQR